MQLAINAAKMELIKFKLKVSKSQKQTPLPKKEKMILRFTDL